MILVPVVLLALFFGYNPFTVGVVAGITVALWTITAIASPRKKGAASKSNSTAFPVIECPACGTPNSITTDERPFRFPCDRMW